METGGRSNALVRKLAIWARDTVRSGQNLVVRRGVAPQRDPGVGDRVDRLFERVAVVVGEVIGRRLGQLECIGEHGRHLGAAHRVRTAVASASTPCRDAVRGNGIDVVLERGTVVIPEVVGGDERQTLGTADEGGHLATGDILARTEVGVGRRITSESDTGRGDRIDVLFVHRCVVIVEVAIDVERGGCSRRNRNEGRSRRDTQRPDSPSSCVHRSCDDHRFEEGVDRCRPIAVAVSEIAEHHVQAERPV